MRIVGVLACVSAIGMSCGSVHDSGGSDGGAGGDGGASDGGGPDGGGDAGVALHGVAVTVMDLDESSDLPLKLQLGGELLDVTSNGKTAFETRLPDLSPYSVGIYGQPEGQMCVLSAGSGFVASEDVNVGVSCYSSFFVVESTADNPDNADGDGVCQDASGNCTLRAAVQESNASVGADLIVLASQTYTLGSAFSCPTDDGVNPALNDLDITESVTRIVGVGTAATTIDGGGVTRLFQVHSGATLMLERLTIRDGDAATCGGAGVQVDPVGTGILTDVTVTDFALAANQGALSYGGTLRIFGSWIHGNQNQALGGAMGGTGMLDIRNSLVSNNTSGTGGGAIFNESGSIDAVNTTFSGNTANTIDSIDGGGAIFSLSGGSMDLRHVTIFDNESTMGDGGGLRLVGAGPYTFVSSIVAGNRAPAGMGPNCNGMLESKGHNLLGDPNGCTVGAMGPNDIWGGAGDPLDPRLSDLGAIGYSGGHLPLATSDAVGNADPSQCPRRDQGRRPRTASSSCDIGAFERQ